jgi:hypothetical protein
MAAVGRTDETQIVNDNVYDNNAKEINPAMLRAVLSSLIESNFNLVDDVLKSLNYDTGITLQQKLDTNNINLLTTKSGLIDVLNQPNGSFVNGNDSVTWQVFPSNGNNGNELYLVVTFPTVGTSNYLPIITWEGFGTWHQNNAVFSSIGTKTNTSINIYLQSVFDNPLGYVNLTLLKL